MGVKAPAGITERFQPCVVHASLAFRMAFEAHGPFRVPCWPIPICQRSTLSLMGTSRTDSVFRGLEVWTRNCEIMRLDVGGGGPLRSGVEAPVGIAFDVQVIFRACEVRELECRSGPIFR